MSIQTAGIDVGATKTEALIRDSKDTRYQHLDTADFTSVDDLLGALTARYGTLDQVAMAMAGRVDRDGSMVLTNVNWPRYRPAAHVRLYNDVQCAAGAMPTLGDAEYRTLIDVDPPTDELVVVAVSTGENSAYRDGNGEVHPAETGHVGWQPWLSANGDDMSYELLRSMQMDSPGNVITVEDAISGDRGFEAIYGFVSTIVGPGSHLERSVTERRHLGRGIGPAVTLAALRGDKCAKVCMDLWGPILGQFLRARVLSHMTRGGALYLYGGVAQAEDVMDYVVSETEFMTHFYGGDANMRSLMESVALRVVVDVPGVHPLTVRGALALTAA